MNSHLHEDSGSGVSPRLLAIAVATVLACQILAFHATRTDDAFITYRYGQNLATGNGLTFNPGERILGSTSPAHMLLSGLVYALAGLAATPSIMAALGCMAWSAQAVGIYFLLLGALGRTRALLVAAAIEFGAALSHKYVAMETNLVAAFAIWAFVAAQHSRFVWTAVLCAGAVLTRPDAWLLVLVLAIECARRERKRAWLPALVFAVPVLPWNLFATWYYGSPLPRGAVEKFQRTDLSTYLEHTLLTPARALLPLVPDYLALTFAWPLILLGAVWLLRRERRFWPVVVYALMHAAAYLVIRPFTMHTWHLYPLDYCAVVFAFSGVCAVGALKARAVRAAGYALLVVLVLASVFRMGKAALSVYEDYWGGARDQTYRRIARYLGKQARAGDSFASPEVGTIAYYSKLNAFDMGGLVTDVEDSGSERAVRFIVLDQFYLGMAPPWDPEFAWRSGGFAAFVFRIPEGRYMRFVLDRGR